MKLHSDSSITVYVLRSLLDNKRYVGMTLNLAKRIAEHNSGKVISTKSRRPFILIYKGEYPNYTRARVREKYFKSAAGRRFLDKLE
jgi:putative endonuclease